MTCRLFLRTVLRRRGYHQQDYWHRGALVQAFSSLFGRNFEHHPCSEFPRTPIYAFSGYDSPKVFSIDTAGQHTGHECPTGVRKIRLVTDLGRSVAQHPWIGWRPLCPSWNYIATIKYRSIFKFQYKVFLLWYWGIQFKTVSLNLEDGYILLKMFIPTTQLFNYSM